VQGEPRTGGSSGSGPRRGIARLDLSKRFRLNSTNRGTSVCDLRDKVAGHAVLPVETRQVPAQKSIVCVIPYKELVENFFFFFFWERGGAFGRLAEKSKMKNDGKTETIDTGN
jgi:hypothetical protein